MDKEGGRRRRKEKSQFLSPPRAGANNLAVDSLGVVLPMIAAMSAPNIRDAFIAW